MNLVSVIENEQLRSDLPQVEIGDYVKVHLKIKEGNRERVQIFEGTIIAKKGSGLTETMTVRRLSYGVGVERILPVHSPKIDKIEVTAIGDGAAGQALLPAAEGRQEGPRPREAALTPTSSRLGHGAPN